MYVYIMLYPRVMTISLKKLIFFLNIQKIDLNWFCQSFLNICYSVNYYFEAKIAFVCPLFLIKNPPGLKEEHSCVLKNECLQFKTEYQDLKCLKRLFKLI